jgi:2-C-methyl-D-erythritol 4-phosphate cytidylyltransferase
LLDAYESAERDGFTATDESQLVERTGKRVQVVQGDALNIKLTSPQDLKMAEMILASIALQTP